MDRANKRSRPSQFIEPLEEDAITPLEEDAITVSSPPPPLPTEERFEYTPPSDSEDPFDTPLPTTSAFESGPESTEVGPIKAGQKTEVQCPSRLAWTYTMEEGLGKRADSGFKQVAWVDALEVVRSRAPSNIQSLSLGFGIHPETRCVTASPEAWDEVLRYHRKSCKWHPPAMATGGYATTLINRPSDSRFSTLFLELPPPLAIPSPYSASGPLRKRRRINNDKLEKEDEKEILQGKVITQLARSRRNILQQAIDLLEEEYSRKLSSEHMDMALDCLETRPNQACLLVLKM
ncbi:hypothetical protein V1507DRAFT_499150 [Lipomyces tetrasporus]